MLDRWMNELSAAEGSAWAVAVASFRVAKIPAGRLPSINSHTIALSKTAHQLRFCFTFVELTFDRCPLDLFPHVLLLLGLEGKFDKDLLELLIDVVDTQLFERIVLENLETVDIQNTNNEVGAALRLHRDIDSTDDPVEQVVV